MPLPKIPVTRKIFSYLLQWSLSAAVVGCRRDQRRWEMKLLLIEDDEHVAAVLADAFAADGPGPAITHTGDDGRAYLAPDRPEAVVLDVRLTTVHAASLRRSAR